MALSKKEAFAQVMEHLVTCPNHGYDQTRRWGDGTTETITLSDGSKIKIAGGDRDCSSAIISAAQAVGIDCNGATYTGNMDSCMVGSGNFNRQSMNFIAQRGDVYLNHVNHTAMCTNPNPDRLAEFSINERGGISGGQVGDQTGGESKTRGYYNYPWNEILQCIVAGNVAGAAVLRRQAVTDAKNNNGLIYMSHSAYIGDNDAVHDGQESGTTKLSLPIEALAIDTSHLNIPGILRVAVSLHLENIGQKNYGEMKGQHIGTKSQSRSIEALGIKILENSTGKKLYLQVHQAGYGWGSTTVIGNEMTFAGSTGQNRALEAYKLWLA